MKGLRMYVYLIIGDLVNWWFTEFLHPKVTVFHFIVKCLGGDSLRLWKSYFSLNLPTNFNIHWSTWSGAYITMVFLPVGESTPGPHFLLIGILWRRVVFLIYLITQRCVCISRDSWIVSYFVSQIVLGLALRNSLLAVLFF